MHVFRGNRMTSYDEFQGIQKAQCWLAVCKSRVMNSSDSAIIKMISLRYGLEGMQRGDKFSFELI